MSVNDQLLECHQQCLSRRKEERTKQARLNACGRERSMQAMIKHLLNAKPVRHEHSLSAIVCPKGASSL